MNKKLILGLALALVLVGGSFMSAHAECAFGCLPHISLSLPTCFSCARNVARDRDMDRPEATCQGAYNFGPATPEPMGAVGY
jgi:hypothetical protein